MGFLLAPIALFLFALVGIVHSIAEIILNISRNSFFKKVSKLKFDFAFDVDVFGNYLFSNTWNWLFASKIKLFGIFGETISSALGRGRRDGSLSFLGFAFSYILDLIWLTDWLQWDVFFSKGKLIWKGGHCKVSIMSNQIIEEIRSRYYANN